MNIGHLKYKDNVILIKEDLRNKIIFTPYIYSVILYSCLSIMYMIKKLNLKII